MITLNCSRGGGILCCISIISISISAIFYGSRIHMNKEYLPVDCIIYKYKIIDKGLICGQRGGCYEDYDDKLYVNIKNKNMTIMLRAPVFGQEPKNINVFKKKYKNVPFNSTCYHDSDYNEYYGNYKHLDTKGSLISMIVFGGILILASIYICYNTLNNENYEELN